MGKSLIDANERYIIGVYEAVAEAKQRGVGPHELDLPAERFLAEGTRVDAVYEASTRPTSMGVWDEV